MKFILCLICIFTLSCGLINKEEPAVKADPKVDLASVSADGCLNLVQLKRIINSPGFSFPSSSVVTKVELGTDAIDRDLRFFSKALWVYRQESLQRMLPLNPVEQVSCSEVTFRTPSGRLLQYKIVDSPSNRLVLKLADAKDVDLTEAEKKALLSRPQPTLYEIELATETSLKLRTTFKIFDPICNPRSLIDLEKTESIQWAASASELPQNFEIDPTYLGHVRKAIGMEAGDESSLLTVDQIKEIERQPLTEELQACPIK